MFVCIPSPRYNVTIVVKSHNGKPIIYIYIFFIFLFFRERRPFPPHESAQRVHAPLESKAAKAVGEAKVKPEP